MTREICTSYWRKPIPTKKFDWQSWENGCEECGPFGYGESEADAIGDLESQMEESE